MTTIQEQFFQEAPLAFTLSEVLVDSKGSPQDFRLSEVNPAFHRLLGCDPSEALGQTMTQWLLEPFRVDGRWLGDFSRVVEEGNRQEFHQLMELDGHYYVVTAFVPKKGYLAVLFHRALNYELARHSLEAVEDSLRVSQAMTQNMFDNSPSAIVIYRVRGNGSSSMDYIIQDINPACQRLHGWDKEHVVGKPLGLVRDNVDQFGIVRAFRQVWNTGIPTTYPAKSYLEKSGFRWYENTIFKLPTGQIVAVYQDITDKKNSEEQLHNEKERLKVTLYSIGDGVIATDSDGRIQILNDVAEALTGWKQEEAKGLPLAKVFNIFNENTGKASADPVARVLQTGNIVSLENHTALRSKDGTIKPIADSAAPIKSQSGEVLGAVLVFRDVTETRAKEAKIEYLSYRDALTGLYNRAFLEMELEQLKTKRVADYPIAVVWGDLDNMKLLNDSFGHETGDEALVKAATAIQSVCSFQDSVIRFGGDEFLVLLSNANLAMAREVCFGIKNACRDIKVAGIELSVSLGYAVKADPSSAWNEVLKQAEDNMYRNKLMNAKTHQKQIMSQIKRVLFEIGHETEDHGLRLAACSIRIGRKMGLPSCQLEHLRLLAEYHDIGKIAVNTDVLLKEEVLSEEEWQEIKKHPEIGYRMAQRIPELAYLADCILAHHERWDGTGYPLGLAGTGIPLLARIFAVADAFDAITHNRPYRGARSPEVAKAEIQKHAGIQFDPEVVTAFLSCYVK